MSYPIRSKDSKSVKTFKHPAVTLSSEGLKYLRHKMPTTTYLDSDDLAHLRARCTEIEIESGTPKDGGLKVFEPKSRDEMDVIFKANGLFQGETNIPSTEYSPGNWHTASYVGGYYLNLFDQQDRSTANAPDRLNKTLLERTSSWKVDQ